MIRSNYDRLIDELIQKLGLNNIERGVNMAPLTTFNIGGLADALLRPENEAQALEAFNMCNELGLPLFLFGKCSNILVSDEGLRGLVMIIGAGLDEFSVSGNTVTAGAGLSLTSLARDTLSSGLEGLEWACGIPGSVGGACAMNAGAYGGEIKNSLKSLRLIKNGKIEQVAVGESDLGYRKSAFSYPDAIVLSASFELSADDGGSHERLMQYTEKRKQKQPLKEHSAGSVFKRPEGHFAGKLIEGAGLKGKRVGGAMVSQKHAGFIVNTGGATSSDVLALIDIIKSEVYKSFGVELESEIKVFGA